MTWTQRLQALLLMGMGLFLYSRVSSGVVLFYINQRFMTLTLLTAVALMVVGVSFYFRPEAPDEEETNELASSWRLAARRRIRQPVSGWGLLIISLPILLGLLVPPQPLGTAALANREINFSGLGPAVASPGSALSAIPPLEKNVMDWLADFQRAPNPAQFDGQEAQVIGFVYRDERFTPDSFMVGRFIVSCCVADAAPIGLIVLWDESLSLTDNTWVEVYGRFEAREFNGRLMPVLIAESVTVTAAPAQPYLYY
jgi:putative membrane protein